MEREVKFLSASETAKRLGISRMRVNQLIQNGTLSAEKIGTVYAIKESVVETFENLERKVGRPHKSDKKLIETILKFSDEN